MTIALLALTGLVSTPAHAQDAGAGVAEEAAAHTFSAEAEAIIRALSVRDPVPACADIEALTQTPVPTLVEVVDHATMPPWVGIRAADCLVQNHSAEIEAELLSWVSTPQTKGLAILALNQLDVMPSELAVKVATTAVEGPLAATARPRIARASDETLKAIAAQ